MVYRKKLLWERRASNNKRQRHFSEVFEEAMKECKDRDNYWIIEHCITEIEKDKGQEFE